MGRERVKVLVAKVIGRVEASYDVQEVQFGKVYRWCPECLVLECECGERLSLSAFMPYCAGCATDHAAAVQEELPDRRLGDEALHPWRYSEDREDGGIPF